MRTNRAPIAGVALAMLLAAPAFAQEGSSATPASTSAKSVGPAKATKPGKPAEPDPLPAPAARLWIIAPWATGNWTMRFDNEGTRPLRIAADIRLLRFELDTSDGVIAGASGVKAAKKKPSKPIVCQLPASVRPDGFPEKNALLLAPGESYVESFDPRLFCFGKEAAAALKGGTVVRARFGWDAPATTTKKPPAPPFAVESTEFPTPVAPLRELMAPTLVLSFAVPPAPPPEPPPKEALPPPPKEAPAKPPSKSWMGRGNGGRGAVLRAAARAEIAKESDTAAKVAPDPTPPKPAIIDENAPRLELAADPFIDASAPDRVALTVTVTNVGHRTAIAALRTRMIALRIEGAGAVTNCSASAPMNAIPREGFQSLKPGGSTSMTLLVGEICRADPFRRPGLYRITPTLMAGESGAELGIAAYTGVVQAKAPALVRLQTGPDPFYARHPHAVPTPKPAPASDDDT